MRKPRAQADAIFKEVGKLVIRWNDLELQLHQLAYDLTDDWFLAAVFSSDLQVSNLIQSIRVLAKECDVEYKKLNHFLDQARPKTAHKLLAREMIFDQVDSLLKCADILRVHRNLYVHCINSPMRVAPYFTVGGLTARSSGRLSDFTVPLKITEIRKVTTAIERAVRHIERLRECIASNQNNKRKTKVKWPTALASYPRLSKPLMALTDRMPLF